MSLIGNLNMVHLKRELLMQEIIKIESISVYNKLRSAKTHHPLITLMDAATVTQMPAGQYTFGLYAIFLKELKCGELKYGRGHYDYQEGTLVFLAPGQVIGVPDNAPKPKGWALLFHPDLIKGSVLGNMIDQYHFFSYEVNEALHVSEDERCMIIDQFRKIQQELTASIDHHSKRILISHLALLLQYCTRFYDRQFITRDQVNKGVLEQFEQLLIQYFKSDMPQEFGTPTVAYFAKKINLSPNYFGDLVKKETGISPLEHIQYKMINIAKDRLFDVQKSIAEIGYELGFKYPQHFTRLFKEKTGMTPLQYRNFN